MTIEVNEIIKIQAQQLCEFIPTPDPVFLHVLEQALQHNVDLNLSDERNTTHDTWRGQNIDQEALSFFKSRVQAV